MKKFQQFAKAPVSVVEADQIIYGAVNAPDSGRQVAKPVDIFEIVPDPAQPRRAIPSAARAGWDGTAASVPEMLGRWVSLADLDIAAYLNPTADWQRPDDVPAGSRDLVDLVDLALSIKEMGLIEPITIVRRDSGWQLDTGERRWLAHHLLYAFFREDKWRKVAAREMQAPDVWRQAAENNARANLNAIGKARQYALLAMDLFKKDGLEFEPIAAFDHERQFYAQVEGLKLPYGKGYQLLAGMNLHNRNEVQRCQALLRLADRVWTLADDTNAPQAVLLRCVDLPEDEALTVIERLSHDVTIQTPKAEAKAASDEFKRTLEKASSKVAKATPDELREMLAASERLTQMIKERLK